MWQRKQTLFLIFSLAAIVVCLLSPVGAIDSPTIGAENLLTNLSWTGNGTSERPAWPLFILIALSGIVSVVTIFIYKNRRLQMKLCTWGMIFDVAWYVYYAVVYFGVPSELDMHFRFGACLPLISCIFLWMAKKGVKADDDLVKSMDRIR